MLLYALRVEALQIIGSTYCFPIILEAIICGSTNQPSLMQICQPIVFPTHFFEVGLCLQHLEAQAITRATGRAIR